MVLLQQLPGGKHVDLPQMTSISTILPYDRNRKQENPVQKEKLLLQAQEIAAEFELSGGDIQRCVDVFRKQLQIGLERDGGAMAQIPTYVTGLPKGTEKGVYLAVDLGGSNCRVCAVTLNGDRTFSLIQSKVAVPQDVMVATRATTLFSWIAVQIEAFLQEHHGLDDKVGENGYRSLQSEQAADSILSLGFTFSFTFEQLSIDKGVLTKWTKGFHNPDVVGKDVCALLQLEMEGLHLPVQLTALANDTVGTLMTSAYTGKEDSYPLLGAILGTGTNGAYVERFSNLVKMHEKEGFNDGSAPELMLLNTEWGGSFDHDLEHLPITSYDLQLDAESVNPLDQVFEKMISGMYLGEILRRVLLSMVEDGNGALFRSLDQPNISQIPKSSALYKPYSVPTALLSVVAADKSEDCKATIDSVAEAISIPASIITLEEAQAIRSIAYSIGRRAAYLAGVAIASVVLHSGRLSSSPDTPISIGIDGSLIEHYPNFEAHMRDAMSQVEGVGVEGERRIAIKIAKDGSGVGAALVALVAATQQRTRPDLGVEEVQKEKSRGSRKKIMSALCMERGCTIL